MSWLPLRPVVGVELTLAQAASAGKDFILWSDQVVDKVPIVQEAIEIQRTVFEIADELGVGDEVRAMVYTIRGAGYLSGPAAAIAAGPAGTAVAGVLGSLAGFGALGAAVAIAAAVGGLVSSIFGGDDSDDVTKKKKQARRRAKEALLELLEHRDLGQLAEEQERIAADLSLADMLPPPGSIGLAQQQHAERAARRATAAKLAAFFRQAAKRLSARRRAVFSRLLDLGRYGQALQVYASLPAKEKSRVSLLLYEGTFTSSGGIGGELKPTSPLPDYGKLLADRLAATVKQLTIQRLAPPPPPSLAGPIALAAGATAGAAYLSPSVREGLSRLLRKVIP